MGGNKEWGRVGEQRIQEKLGTAGAAAAAAVRSLQTPVDLARTRRRCGGDALLWSQGEGRQARPGGLWVRHLGCDADGGGLKPLQHSDRQPQVSKTAAGRTDVHSALATSTWPAKSLFRLQAFPKFA